MNNRHRFTVFMPSLSSGTTTALLSSAILGVSLYIYTSQSGFLYEYLFGDSSSAEIIKSSKNTLRAFNNLVFGNPILNKFLYFAFWMLVGLIVYLILYALTRSTSTAAEDIKESMYVNIRHDDAFRSVVARAGIRLFVLTLWIIYAVIYLKTLLPISVALAKHGGSHLTTAYGWAYILGAFVSLFIFTHLNFIFMRFLLLRVRVFDNGDFVEV